MIAQGLTSSVYIAASILFILSLGGLSHPESARRGNLFGMAGMAIAIGATLLAFTPSSYGLVLGVMAVGGAAGSTLAVRVEMTAMPQLVAMLHSFVGLAAVLVGFGSFLDPGTHFTGPEKVVHDIEIFLGVLIGAVTFTGSVAAFGKLQGILHSRSLMLPGRHLINLGIGVACIWLGILFVGADTVDAGMWPLLIMTGLAFTFGLHMVLAIGGADMPVVISMLNSYSGWAAAATGFMLANDLLIVTGALVGSSGAILSYIMCRAMNRSFFSVILGGFGANVSYDSSDNADKNAKSGSADDAAFIMKNSQNIVIVPGYGMAVAQAQHQVRDLANLLESRGVEVEFAIHPVAGRMPGHMNVLLAEADVDYDKLKEMDTVNPSFEQTDVSLVLGANDIVNPIARTDPSSPIAGMPILDVDKSRTVVVVKRSLSPGFAGIPNPLFAADNTLMLFADGKQAMLDLIVAVKDT